MNISNGNEYIPEPLIFWLSIKPFDIRKQDKQVTGKVYQ